MHRLSIQNQRKYLYFFVQRGVTQGDHVMSSRLHGIMEAFSGTVLKSSFTRFHILKLKVNSQECLKTIRIFYGSRLEIGLLWGGKVICPHKNPKEWVWGFGEYISHLLHLRVLPTRLQSARMQNEGPSLDGTHHCLHFCFHSAVLASLIIHDPGRDKK